MAFVTRLTSKSPANQEVYYPSDIVNGCVSTQWTLYSYTTIEQRKATVRAVERELDEVDEIVS